MGHDRSVAVVQDGKIIVAIEQERLDRIKHSVGFMLQSPDAMGQIQVPGESITYCLDHLGLKLGDVATITPNMPGVDLAPQILRGKFSRDLKSKVRMVPSHHLAHAYSATSSSESSRLPHPAVLISPLCCAVYDRTVVCFLGCLVANPNHNFLYLTTHIILLPRFHFLRIFAAS